jgi:prepilin-type N-terminal cleavage/methylation domain-containing protein
MLRREAGVSDGSTHLGPERTAFRARAAHKRGASSGFTLIEIMVAIAIGGLVLLGARSLLEALADEEGHVAREAAIHDARANGERLLRDLVGQMEVGTKEGGSFAGDPGEATFTSWCDVPAGWQERCRVTIAVENAIESDSESARASIRASDGESDRTGPALVARLPGGRRVVLRTGFRAGELRYLNSAASGGQWFRQWGQGITAPLAIGVLLERESSDVEGFVVDTLIVRIGERG